MQQGIHYVWSCHKTMGLESKLLVRGDFLVVDLVLLYVWTWYEASCTLSCPGASSTQNLLKLFLTESAGWKPLLNEEDSCLLSTKSID